MDRRERFEDFQVAMLAAQAGHQADIWTALPGFVTRDLNPATKTCEVQICIQMKVTAADGSFEWVTIKPLLDCPVYFPSGGGCTLTFPLKVGDECLVVFASRCIDAWWQSGGIQNQPILRMHNLSDGFVFAGISSLPNIPVDISTTSVQLRSNDGGAVIQLNPDTHAIDVTTSAGVTVSAGGNVTATVGGELNATVTGNTTIASPNIVLQGNVVIAGTISQTGGGTATFSGAVQVDGSVAAQGDVSGAGISLSAHVHSGVQSGGSNTGGPI